MLDVDDGLFQLQARTGAAPGGSNATIFTGIAAKEVNASLVEGRLLPGGRQKKRDN